jgi:hypothetical protein
MAIVHFLIWTACAAVQEPSESDRNQDQRGNRTIELRVYFNALTPPKTAADQKDVPPEDLSLLMAITSSPNKAKTYVMERVALKEGEAPASGQRSQVRKLEGTAYYARLAAVGAEPPAKNGSGKATPQEPAPAEAKGDTESKEPKQTEPGDVLRRVYFKVQLKPEDFPKAFKATLTLRAGTRTFSARTYAYPFTGDEEAAYGRIESSLKDIVTAMDTTAFGRIPPITVKISDDLDELAGVTINDPKGDKEYDRQWCQALCKKIERASYRGDDDVRSLVQQFEARLRRLKEGPGAAPAAPKEAPAPTAPEAPKKDETPKKEK